MKLIEENRNRIRRIVAMMVLSQVCLVSPPLALALDASIWHRRSGGGNDHRGNHKIYHQLLANFIHAAWLRKNSGLITKTLISSTEQATPLQQKITEHTGAHVLPAGIYLSNIEAESYSGQRSAIAPTDKILTIPLAVAGDYLAMALSDTSEPPTTHAARKHIQDTLFGFAQLRHQCDYKNKINFDIDLSKTLHTHIHHLSDLEALSQVLITNQSSKNANELFARYGLGSDTVLRDMMIKTARDNNGSIQSSTSHTEQGSDLDHIPLIPLRIRALLVASGMHMTMTPRDSTSIASAATDLLFTIGAIASENSTYQEGFLKLCRERYKDQPHLVDPSVWTAGTAREQLLQFVNHVIGKSVPLWLIGYVSTTYKESTASGIEGFSPLDFQYQ